MQKNSVLAFGENSYPVVIGHALETHGNVVISNCRDSLLAYLVEYITKRHQPAITRNVSKSCQPNKINPADLRRHNVDMTQKMYYWLFQWESTGIAHCPWTMISFNSHNKLGNFYIPIQ